MEGYLKNCECIVTMRSVWGGGPIGSMQRLNMVAIAISFPNQNHKHGKVNLLEIKSFPKKMKLYIQAPYVLCFSTLSAVAVFALWLKMQ